MKKLAGKLLAASIVSALCLTVILSWIHKTPYQAAYRDLNKNGKMDVYEDKTQPIEKRIDDLIKQMTIEEKAGMMFINGTLINEDGTIEKRPGQGMFANLAGPAELINGKKMNHFNFWVAPGTKAWVKGYNAIQKEAENSRLGIPVTIASDPRNHFSANIFSMAATDFSQWCEPLGFAAIGDEKLMERFADVIRQESGKHCIPWLIWQQNHAGRVSVAHLGKMPNSPLK